MSLCPSGILMAALTSSILLSDLANSRSDRLISHLFLGGIITALFYMLCQRGYEMINWVIILVIPVYMLVRWLVSGSPVVENETKYFDDDDECPVCRSPPRNCGCSPDMSPVVKKGCPASCPTSTIKKESKEDKSTSGCPAKPITLSTVCGISRYN